nr:BCII_beta_lactamase [uncultured bacterium]
MKTLLILCISLLSWASALAQSPTIQVSKLEENFYVHTSYNTYQGQLVPSNGMIVNTPKGVILIDTAWGDEQTQQLLAWIKKELRRKVILVIVTHAHSDRMGGIRTITKEKIRIVSTPFIRERAGQINENYGEYRPEPALSSDTTLTFGSLKTRVFYPGKGHAPENVVVWFPAQKILFGGCFIKSVASTNLGNLSDADIPEWKLSLHRTEEKFPKPNIVIPGHGDPGGPELLTRTRELLDIGK